MNSFYILVYIFFCSKILVDSQRTNLNVLVKTIHLYLNWSGKTLKDTTLDSKSKPRKMLMSMSILEKSKLAMENVSTA